MKYLISYSKGKESKISYFSLDEMLNFSWEVAIGDKTISKKDFLELTKNAQGLIKFKDQYILLKPEEVKNIINKLNKPLPRLSSLDVLRSAFMGEYEDILPKPDEALKRILDNLTKYKEIGLPKSCKQICVHIGKGVLNGFIQIYHGALVVVLQMIWDLEKHCRY